IQQQQKQLVTRLRDEYVRLTEETERRELEKQKQKKRWKFAHCEISADNIMEGEAGGAVEVAAATIAAKKASRKDASRRRRRPNGYLKDEIEGLVDEFSDSSEDDEDDVSSSNDDNTDR